MVVVFSSLIVFIFGVPILLMMEHWIPLLGAIFLGDSSHLKEDMLESGICEKKRESWIPPPEPRPVGCPSPPRCIQPWTPPKRKPRPKSVALPRYREREPELEQLAQELFAELED